MAEAASMQSPAEVIALLQAAVKEKDATLAQLKSKTKIFVQEMRGELNQAKAGKEAAEQECATLKAQLQALPPAASPPSQQQQHPGEEGSEGVTNGNSSGKQKAEALQIQTLQAELSKAHATAKQTQEELAMHKQQSHTLMTQLAEAQKHQKDAEALRRRVGNLQEEVKMAKEQHAEVLNELAGKEKEMVGLEKALQESKAAAAAAAAAATGAAAAAETAHDKAQQEQSKKLREIQQQLEEQQQRFEQQKQEQEQLLQQQQQVQQEPEYSQASLPAPIPPQQDEASMGDLIDFDYTDRVSPLPPLALPTIPATTSSSSTRSVSPMTAAFTAAAQAPLTALSTAAPLAAATPAAVVDSDAISLLQASFEEAHASLQAKEEELAAAHAEVTLLLQTQETNAAVLAQLQSDLVTAQEAAATAAAAAAAAVKKEEGEKQIQEERGLEGLDGPTQHLKAQLLERELTVQGKTTLLERCQAELATISSEREALQQQVGTLAAEKEGLVAAVEKLTSSSSTLEGTCEEAVREREELKEECVKLKAVLVGLEEAQRAHDDQMRSVRHEAEETVKRVKSDAETELSAARFQLQEAEKAQGQAEKTAANLRVQMEELQRSLTQGMEESSLAVAALEKERGQLVAELELERENGQERRRQMKQYLETLTKEKQEREAELAVATTALAAARREQGGLEEMVQALQERLAVQVETNEGEVRRLEERLREQERRHAESVLEKDGEIERLREEQMMRLSSTARQSEEMESQLKAVEAETAAHKQKRLAAKNEMISLAQALEDLTTTSRLMEESIEHTVIPRCLEQLSLLDRAIDQVDAAVWQLTRRGPGGGGGGGSSFSTTTTTRRGEGADGRARSRTGSLGVEMGRLRLGTGGSSVGGGGGSGGGGKNGAARTRSPSGDHLLREEEEEEDIEHDVQHLSDVGEGGGRGGGGGRDHRGRTKSMLTMERLQRLDVETGRVSAGVQTLAQSLERLQRGLEALAEDGLEGHSSAQDAVSLCSKVLGECFSFMRQTPVVNAGVTGSAIGTASSSSSSSSSSRGQRPVRTPYVAVLREEEEEDRVIDVV